MDLGSHSIRLAHQEERCGARPFHSCRAPAPSRKWGGVKPRGGELVDQTNASNLLEHHQLSALQIFAPLLYILGLTVPLYPKSFSAVQV